MDWFRMYHEFASDAKVQSMPEAMQRRLVMLLCLRCSNALVTLHETEIAFALRITEEELEQTKALFLRKGFITEDWEIENWEKRQFVSDSSAARVARHRAAKKEAEKHAEKRDETTCNVTVTPQIQNRTDTEQIKTIVINDVDSAKSNCPHQQIIDLYHEILPTLTQVKDWTPKRAAQLKARWNEDKTRQNLDYWRRFFEYVKTCPFLMGEGKTPFRVNLEWMTKSENFTKIREGNYEPR